MGIPSSGFFYSRLTKRFIIESQNAILGKIKLYFPDQNYFRSRRDIADTDNGQ